MDHARLARKRDISFYQENIPLVPLSCVFEEIMQ